MEETDRRARQRIYTAQPGVPRFWLRHGGHQLPVSDLSLDGFSFAASSPPRANENFEFLLFWEGGSGEVHGRAQAVNYLRGVAGGQAGCRFVSLDKNDGSQERLRQWLTLHILKTALVPLQREEAEEILYGPSLI